MPSRTTVNQVNHLIPRGEIKFQHGRQMRSSKTSYICNSKHLAKTLNKAIQKPRQPMAVTKQRAQESLLVARMQTRAIA